MKALCPFLGACRDIQDATVSALWHILDIEIQMAWEFQFSS